MHIEQKGRKTIVTLNGTTKEHKTAYLNTLNFKDAINYIKQYHE